MQRCESGMIYSGFSRLLKNSDSASGPGKRFRIRLKLLKHVRNCQKIPLSFQKNQKRYNQFTLNDHSTVFSAQFKQKRSTGKILTIYLVFLPRSGSEKNNSRSWKKFLFQPDPEVLNTAEMYHQRYLILSTYSEVFWLAMLEGAMCSLKSGPKYSK